MKETTSRIDDRTASLDASSDRLGNTKAPREDLKAQIFAGFKKRAFGIVIACLLAYFLFAPKAEAIKLGNDWELTPAVALILAGDLLDSSSSFATGGSVRLWFGRHFLISPNFSWVYNVSSHELNSQYGGLIGWAFKSMPSVLYFGASYSTYDKHLSDRYAINYGLRMDVPAVPLLTIGFDGSYQPYSGSKHGYNRLAFTLGLAI